MEPTSNFHRKIDNAEGNSTARALTARLGTSPCRSGGEKTLLERGVTLIYQALQLRGKKAEYVTMLQDLIDFSFGDAALETLEHHSTTETTPGSIPLNGSP